MAVMCHCSYTPVIMGEFNAFIDLQVEQVWIWKCWLRLVFDLGPPGESGVYIDLMDFRITDTGGNESKIRLLEEDPVTAAPALVLLNRRVTDAQVRDWELTLAFDSGARVACPPHPDHEAWGACLPDESHYYCPPGGRRGGPDWPHPDEPPTPGALAWRARLNERLGINLRWADVKEFFDPETNGHLPNLTVENTNDADWEALLDLIRLQGWVWGYASRPAPESGNDPRRGMPSLAALRSSHQTLATWPTYAGFQVNFFPDLGPQQIRFDVDPRQVQGQQELNQLCKLIRLIGRTLGKPVSMSPEGDDDHPFLIYDIEADAVVMLPTAAR
jgi:hypothetical protein